MRTLTDLPRVGKSASLLSEILFAYSLLICIIHAPSAIYLYYWRLATWYLMLFNLALNTRSRLCRRILICRVFDEHAKIYIYISISQIGTKTEQIDVESALTL